MGASQFPSQACGAFECGLAGRREGSLEFSATHSQKQIPIIRYLFCFKEGKEILEGLESDLVVPVEAELIHRYRPLWNCVVDGFGNHDPGKGRYNQARSEWDVLHPGRPWADRLTGKSPRMKDILAKIERSKQALTLP